MAPSTVTRHTDATPHEPSGLIPIGLFLGECLLLILLFASYAGQAIPNVNESHYLTKAKHFWNPEWCDSDLFLTSSNPHVVFYVLFGWLTLFFPLGTVAWIGRWITWTLLAISWQRLSFAVVEKRFLGITTAALFLICVDRFHLAGEWVIGGVEAKSFAFAFVFLGLSEMVVGRWPRAWVWLGIASAFHVLVGGWCCLAVLFVFLLQKLTKKESLHDDTRIAKQIPMLLLGGAISLLGVIPPLLSNMRVDPDVADQANWINVTQRLRHHQYFVAFPAIRVAMFSLLILAWALLKRLTGDSTKLRKLNQLSLAALLISLVGILLSGLVQSYQNQFAVNLLVYYWFRLSDVAVPLATTFALVAIFLNSASSKSSRKADKQGGLGMRGIVLMAAVTGVLIGVLGIIASHRWSDRRPLADQRSLVSFEGQPKRTQEAYENWRIACDWVRQNTNQDAVFLTPAQQQTFKWYAERAEIVCWKDAPQDALGLIEWYGRVRRFHRTQFDYQGGLWAYTDQQLLDIAAETGATHIMTLQSDLDARTTAAPRLTQLYPVDPTSKATYVVFELKRVE